MTPAAHQFELDRRMRLPQYFIGLDLGKVRDFTALVVDRRTPVRVPEGVRYQHDLVGLDRYRDRPYPAIVREVADLLKRPEFHRHPELGDLRPPTLAVDATGCGSAVVDLFVEAGLPCDLRPVTITSGDRARAAVEGGARRHWVPKRDLAGVMQVVLQGRRIKVAPGPFTDVLKQELLNFSVKVTAAGNQTYGAAEDWRERNHDDLVLGAAIAVWVAELPGPAVASLTALNFGAAGGRGTWGSVDAGWRG